MSARGRKLSLVWQCGSLKGMDECQNAKALELMDWHLRWSSIHKDYFWCEKCTWVYVLLLVSQCNISKWCFYHLEEVMAEGIDIRPCLARMLIFCTVFKKAHMQFLLAPARGAQLGLPAGSVRSLKSVCVWWRPNAFWHSMDYNWVMLQSCRPNQS